MVLVRIQQPDLISVGARKSVWTIDTGTRNGPETHFSRCAVGTRSLNLIRPVSTLYKVEAILESVVDGTQLIEPSEDPTRIGSRIEVIEGIPIILTAHQRLAQGHVEVLRRAKFVATMTLPCLVTDHRLTTV